MAEAEPGGVECLAGEIQQLAAHWLGQTPRDGGNSPEIYGVADDWMRPVREMDTNLVRPSGSQPTLQQRDGSLPGPQHAVARQGRLSAPLADRHALAGPRVAAD